MLLKNMQANILPNVWRFVSFEAVIELSQRLEAKPLTDDPNAVVASSKLFQRKSLSMRENNVVRCYVDWRKAFTIFALMAGQVPSEAQKQTYFSKLRAKRLSSENGLLTKEAFISVSQISLFANFLYSFRLTLGSTDVKVRLSWRISEPSAQMIQTM